MSSLQHIFTTPHCTIHVVNNQAAFYDHNAIGSTVTLTSLGADPAGVAMQGTATSAEALQTFFSPDGRLAATAFTRDGGVAVWSTATGELLGRLTAHRGSVNQAAFSPTHPRVLATVGNDEKLILSSVITVYETANTASFTTLQTLLDVAGSVASVAWSSCGTYLVAGGGNTCRAPAGQQVILYRVDYGGGSSNDNNNTRVTATCLRIFAGHSGSIRTVTFHPECPSIILSASGDGSIRVWDRHRDEEKDSGCVAMTNLGHKVEMAWFFKHAAVVDSWCIVTCDFSGSACIFELVGGCNNSGGNNARLVLLHRVDHSAGKILYSVDTSFENDGATRTLLTAGNDSMMRCWDLTTGMQLPMRIYAKDFPAAALEWFRGGEQHNNNDSHSLLVPHQRSGHNGLGR